MTLCAGVCAFKGGNDVVIRLSEKLLKYRPESDLVNTLLHEMIHAFLFLTARISHGHGQDFIFHMNRINTLAGTQITIFHNFHSEVAYYRVHEWKCDGPCRFLSPFYGVVKRAINRAPCPADWWWARHQATCGGTFHKVEISKSEISKTQNKKNEKSKERGQKTIIAERQKVKEDFFARRPASMANCEFSGCKSTDLTVDESVFVDSSSMNSSLSNRYVDLTID
jgi:predicted SprT family Zn-dependent metalloprotease